MSLNSPTLAAPSPFVSADRVRPLRHVNDAMRAAMQARVIGAWQGWSDAWYPAAATADIRTAVAEELAVDRRLAWRALSDGAAQGLHAQVWLGLPSDMALALSDRWFDRAQPSPASSDLALAVAREALDDLSVRIAQSVGLSVATLPASSATGEPSAALVDRWAGAVLVEVASPVGAIAVLLGGAIAAMLHLRQAAELGMRSADQVPLLPLAQAVEDARLCLVAELDPVELTVGELAGLRAGDAITLTHRLDRPILLRSRAGQIVCRGTPGRIGDQKAVCLLPVAGSPHA